jgi:hypothetical protein
MIRALAFAAAFGLAACATTPRPPPYLAAASASSIGYSETQIESNRYFVTYRAPSGAELAVLQDYALLRAAELTLQHGRDWFWLDRRSAEGEDRRSRGPSVGVGVGGGSWGRRSGASVGVGVNFPLGGGQSGPMARAATVEIRLGEGAKPDDPNAYDARSTAANLRARVAG